MSAETPRTDDLCKHFSVSDVPAGIQLKDMTDFSRQLERELIEARAEIERLKAGEECHVARPGEGTLECRHDDLCLCCERNSLRVQLAETEKDAERYRHIRAGKGDPRYRVKACQVAFDGYPIILSGETLDAAIDAALASDRSGEEA